MSEMMMSSVFELTQPHHEATKHGGNMFPDVHHYYDYVPETGIGNDRFDSEKLIDSQEEFQNNSDHTLFDLNVSDLQFSDLLLVPGMNTFDEFSIKSPQVTPEVCQNLEEDIFKTYPCLADAVSPSAGEQQYNVSSNSYNIFQRQNTLTELDRLVENNDIVYDRFKMRSSSVDSHFTNYQEKTSWLSESSIPTASTHFEYTELRSLDATCVIDTSPEPSLKSQYHQQSFVDEKSIPTNNISALENEYDSNEYPVCSPPAPAKTFENASMMDSFIDSIYELHFPPQSSHTVDESIGNSSEASQSSSDSLVEVTPQSGSLVDSQEESICGSSPSQEIFLPTTLDSICSETSAEVSFESLPESLLHLDSVPKASCTPSKPTSRRKRGRKLWEFLLDLLEDTACNPSLIRWEDKPKGVFRLKEQEVIARKWGKRRDKKDNLSYDYFARALRYHYKSKMLVSVPERKLVYKFGPKVLSQMK